MKLSNIFKRKSKPKSVLPVFPKGTVVVYGGVPCELLESVAFYSATYQQPKPSAGERKP